MDGSGRTTDLLQILANLAQIGNPAQTSAAADGGNHATTLQNESSTTHQERSLRIGDSTLRPQRSSVASPKPMIDPATITTWQDGLRCVTKMAAQNTQFSNRIRLMMERQRRQEMSWYQERQALKQRQANRSRSLNDAQSILRSLTNGGSSSSEPNTASIDEVAELASFDRKVYESQAAMEADMTAELKALGVPFFGTAKELIVAEDDTALQVASTNERPKWSPPVTEEQLMKLRKRMVEHLEDLYRD